MKNNKQPEIRFPGFHEEWVHRKLKEIVIRDIKGKARAQFAGGTSNYLDANRLNGGEIMLVDSPEDVSEEDVIILWDGSQAGTVYHGFKGALGSTLKAYSIDGSGSFVYQQLKKNQQNIYERYRTPNIPHVVKSFTEEYSIFVPGLEEQKQIGYFFKQLDDTIALHQQELTTLKQTKQGFLQKMFPKEGEKVPEIRFSGFVGDWEQRKLSEIIKLIGGNAFSSNSSTKEGVPWLKIANVDKNGIVWSTQSFLPSEYWEKYPDYQLTPGDYVMALTRPILNHTLKIGKVDKLALLNQRVAKLDFNLNKKFTFQLIQRRTIVDKIENELAGTDPPNLGSKNLTNIRLMITNNKDEQRKIGDLFNFFDDTIALHQRELDLLKETKKAFLQKMFV